MSGIFINKHYILKYIKQINKSFSISTFQEHVAQWFSLRLTAKDQLLILPELIKIYFINFSYKKHVLKQFLDWKIEQISIFWNIFLVQVKDEIQFLQQNQSKLQECDPNEFHVILIQSNHGHQHPQTLHWQLSTGLLAKK